MSAHLENFEVQYLITKHLITLVLDAFFTHLFRLLQAIASVFKIALLQIWPNLNHTNKTPANPYVADFKQPFPNIAHVIPNPKQQTVSFQMAYNVTMCTVGPLNLPKIDFGRCTTSEI